MSIYDKNKVLFLPFTTKKADNAKVPSLIPHECDIFKCCASYIQSDFEDWDAKIPVAEVPKFEMKSILSDDNEPVYEGTLNFPEIMKKISKERATI
jgi:hypothetical protein